MSFFTRPEKLTFNFKPRSFSGLKCLCSDRNFWHFDFNFGYSNGFRISIFLNWRECQKLIVPYTNTHTYACNANEKSIRFNVTRNRVNLKRISLENWTKLCVLHSFYTMSVRANKCKSLCEWVSVFLCCLMWLLLAQSGQRLTKLRKWTKSVLAHLLFSLRRWVSVDKMCQAHNIIILMNFLSMQKDHS